MDEYMLFIVCVVYNKYIKEIASYNQFVKSSKSNKCVRFIVIDNSTEEDVLLANLKMEKEFIYLNSGGNIGLSRAYNKALAYIDEQKLLTDNIWVMLADDDTVFSEKYLNNLNDTIIDISANSKRCALISTNIKTNYGYMSPFTIKGLKISAFEGEVGKYYSNTYTINSGLCIKRDLLRLVGDYDEKLFLDYVDIYFFDRVRKFGKDRLLIIDGDVKQNFSSIQGKTNENSKKRYLIFKKDFTQYCKVTNKSVFFWLFILGKRRLNIISNSIGLFKCI